jgi:hypothetical protein
MFKEYTPLEYLAIDIANNFSSKLEKSVFEDRIAWFNKNKHQLFDLYDQAEEPALYYSGICAYNDYQNNKPSGHVIRLDACASGLQIMSALTNDLTSATLCGLNNPDNRANAYKSLYNKIDPDNKKEYADVKQAIMTAFYGSLEEPKKLLGEGELHTKFYETLFKECNGPFMLNLALQKSWNSEATHFEMTMPDGFNAVLPVEQKVKIPYTLNDVERYLTKTVVAPKDKSVSLSANTIHAIDAFIVREINRRANFNPDQYKYITEIFQFGKCSKHRPEDKQVLRLWDLYKKTNILSVRIMDYLDEYNIGNIDCSVLAKEMLTFGNKPFELITVHDSFGCLPKYCNDVRRLYTLMLAKLSESTLLDHLFTQITGKTTQLTKTKSISNYILSSNYTLS